MEITVEISFYPLAVDFGHHVVSFIKDLRQHEGLQIKSNSMSTMVRGDINIMWPALQAVLNDHLQRGFSASVAMKIFNEGLEIAWLDI